MTHIITCSSIIVSAYCLLPAFVVVILKFCFHRLNNRSTCQRLLYKYKISSPLYSIPSVVITTIQPEQNKVSCVISFWFFEAFLYLRFLALRACSSGSFCAIIRTKPVLLLYLQIPKTSTIQTPWSSACFNRDTKDIFLSSASYRQNVFGVIRRITSACCSCA